MRETDSVFGLLNPPKSSHLKCLLVQVGWSVLMNGPLKGSLSLNVIIKHRRSRHAVPEWKSFLEEVETTTQLLQVPPTFFFFFLQSYLRQVNLFN